jgi:hypothetical protein
MLYLSASSHYLIQEAPSAYSPFSRKNMVYEVSLRVASSTHWLNDLAHAHRLVRALLQGEVLGGYELVDFLVWPEGVFTRISLKKAPSLAECLKFIKEKSVPPETDPGAYWKDEPQWIRLVPPEKFKESSQSFLDTAESIRRGPSAFSGSAPSLFFFYRNPRFNPSKNP